MTGIKNEKTLRKGSLAVEDTIKIDGGVINASTVTGILTGSRDIGTLNVTPVNPTNKLLLTFTVIIRSIAAPASEIAIFEGAVEKASLTVPVAPLAQRTVSVVLTDVSASLHTYTFKIIHNGGAGDYIYADGTHNFADSFRCPTFDAVLADYDDTHDTDEDNIIGGG